MEEVEANLYRMVIHEDDEHQEYANFVMFDLDDTLVHTKSRKKFPQASDDWEWNPGVWDKLKALAAEGTAIFIITNQSGLSRNINRKTLILRRVANILLAMKSLTSPVYAYIAGGMDDFRKPNTTVFEKYIMEDIQDWVGLEKMKNLIYVGDAAGRPNDFSDTDRKFAYNLHLLLKYLKLACNVVFYTPEEYFQGAKKQLIGVKWQGFDPQTFLKKDIKSFTSLSHQEYFAQFLQQLPTSGITVLLFMGPPASGKSTLANMVTKHKPSYHILSMDRGLTQAKCVKTMESLVRARTNVIIENTNASPHVREQYFQRLRELQKEYPGLTYYIVWMSTYAANGHSERDDRLLYQHVNIYRERIGERARIPEIAYDIYYKNYEPPEESEAPVIPYMFIPEFNKPREMLYFMQKSE